MEDDDDAQSLSCSQSQSVSRSLSPPPVSVVSPSPGPSPHHHHNGQVAEAVTVAAPPNHALPLALPIQQPRASPAAGGGGGGGREDCWSEGATSILIDAWGERFLELSRGNLKQKHWQEVADAVTSRDGYTKAPKTDVQCKNRIDTLKKKYKIEKSKISATGGGATCSWPFFHRLDLLLGPNHKPAPPPPGSDIPAGIPIRPPAHLPQLIPQRPRTSQPARKKARSSPPSVSSKSADSSGDSSDGFPPPPPRVANGKRQRREPEEEEEGGGGRTAGLRELTQAILRFGEVYERVESSKLRQALEIEKQRMEFTRELELQRMEFLMKTQMELSQLNSNHHHHHGSNSRKKKRMDDAGGSSSNHHRHHNNSSNSNHSENNG
ncbi:hypothetical protein BHM03_00054091 [Ensete ventricosum]|nr:hypothetical protein BHM03_00054091 [Ensete ventricosum]